MSDVVNYVDAPARVAWTGPDSETASLTVTKPDGTTLAPALIVTDASAAHTATLTPTLPGRYVLRWITATETFVDILDVWPTDPRFLVSRERAMERLQQRNNKAGDKFDAIMLYIAAASAVVEWHTGPLFTTQETWVEVSMYGQPAIVLPHQDVTDVVLQIDGSLISESAYTVDDPAGIIHAYVPRGSKVSVTYNVGGTVIPVAAQMACLEIIAHSWQQTRQSATPVTDDGMQTVVTSMGYAIPKRALEWLQTLPRVAGAA